MKSGAANRRLLSGLELLAGAAIVIGHNVFRVVPNEVIILAILGLRSVRIRNGSWFAMGFKRPESWRLILLVALAAVLFGIGHWYEGPSGVAALYFGWDA